MILHKQTLRINYPLRLLFPFTTTNDDDHRLTENETTIIRIVIIISLTKEFAFKSCQQALSSRHCSSSPRRVEFILLLRFVSLLSHYVCIVLQVLIV